MSSVVGIDISSHAIDLVKLDEETDHAEWSRLELRGNTAWDRTLDVRRVMPTSRFWEDVYLVAFERPESRFHGVLHAYLPVLGATAALIPENMTVWQFAPKEWRTACRLPGNATKVDVAAWATDRWPDQPVDAPQDAMDAYAVAWAARDINARGIAAALRPVTHA